MTADVPSLVIAAGGEIVGKIRLQKVVYLLDRMGLDSGFSYEYYHYGPYSEDLAEKIEDDIVFGHLHASQRRRLSDGVPYVAYSAEAEGDGDKADAHMPIGRIRTALAEMQRHSSTVLELAATIHWLAVVEGISDWKTELVRRKGAKTGNNRALKAFELLRTLGLPPAVGSAVRS
ncbi:hypothetical protein OZ411_24070 [Bradyrhizobium sp. Arg237L]|uniref:hypothetical protein n=1 Tax=Bradyrhizobium sp. Arg237L TaxID=3003352 RepID=UPI00249F2B79|nr:hypothetical protein [Bradyrhizobium sp. Arg237L]MDI4235892.1 hypothetical protein [Bradyrhizobium sp. Arg237L]